MPSPFHNAVPRFTKHASGQAVVRLSGKDFYLGKYGSPSAQQEYDRLVQEWLAQGRQLPAQDSPITVNELILAYWKRCEKHYRKPDGTPTSELDLVRQALRHVRHLYGTTAAWSFGPLALKAVRDRMVNNNLARRVINKHIGRVRQMFRWAVENELLPVSSYQALQSVIGLQRGRTEAKETEPVRPVPEPMIQAVQPFASRQIWAMIQLQLLTGMRPGEVCIMRSGDIDMTSGTWTYRPEAHKTEHHGHRREIFIGPKGQAILKPFLRPDSQAYLFSAMDAREERSAARRAVRKSKVQPSQLSRRKGSPKKAPRNRYDVASYRRAIAYACAKAFPLPEALAPVKKENQSAWQARLTDEEKQAIAKWRKQHTWHPHQLRHNAASNLRKEFGIEVARIILGHQTAFSTEIYAETDKRRAVDIMAQVG